MTLSDTTLTFRPKTFTAHGDTVDPQWGVVYADNVFYGYASIVAVAKEGYQLNNLVKFAIGASYEITPPTEDFTGTWLSA